jgi:hypothetical protein
MTVNHYTPLWRATSRSHRRSPLASLYLVLRLILRLCQTFSFYALTCANSNPRSSARNNQRRIYKWEFTTGPVRPGLNTVMDLPSQIGQYRESSGTCL